ncbi:MAG: transposase [Chloroflexi bacterium]|nr:transposase [Chloroflexota bacterium]
MSGPQDLECVGQGERVQSRPGGGRLLSAYYVSNQEVARLVAKQVLERWQRIYSSAMRSFLDDIAACIAYLGCPADHHKYLRTTNLADRSFEEERRRARVVRAFEARKRA